MNNECIPKNPIYVYIVKFGSLSKMIKMVIGLPIHKLFVIS